MPVSFNANCMKSLWIKFIVSILGSFTHTCKTCYVKYHFFTFNHISLSLTYTFMGHNIWALWASVLPICAHLTSHSHPLNSSLDKEGSLFLMDSICFFPIPTVGNMEMPLLISLFTVPHFLPPLLYTSQTEHCMISYIFEYFCESETQQMQIFLLPSDMLFFRRKLNWLVTLCMTLVIQPVIVMLGRGGHNFSQTYFYAFLSGFRHIKKNFSCQLDGELVEWFL